MMLKDNEKQRALLLSQTLRGLLKAWQDGERDVARLEAQALQASPTLAAAAARVQRARAVFGATQADELPLLTPTFQAYDSGDYPAMLDIAAAKIAAINRPIISRLALAIGKEADKRP